MQFGVVLPGGTAVQQLELAVVAEQAGWDGRADLGEVARVWLAEPGPPAA